MTDEELQAAVEYLNRRNEELLGISAAAIAEWQVLHQAQQVLFAVWEARIAAKRAAEGN